MPMAVLSVPLHASVTMEGAGPTTWERSSGSPSLSSGVSPSKNPQMLSLVMRSPGQPAGVAVHHALVTPPVLPPVTRLWPVRHVYVEGLDLQSSNMPYALDCLP